MIFMLDNYDSFTFNLYQAFTHIGAEVEVVRNDAVTVDEVMDRVEEIDGLVVSPGPCSPDEAGISVELIRRISGVRPVLGVCLGHQAMAQAFGATIIHAPSLMHGKTSLIEHDGLGVYEGLPNPFPATRYHSLTVDRASVPAMFKVTAMSSDGVIQGLRHRELDVEGVQFHPESILTTAGPDLLRNFVAKLGLAHDRAGEPVKVLGY
ncbi:MAG TPA: aminodeoxychorismate/anthranilate synthase component II [Thermomicrobiales bacterium]|nr:aminodeoxychorismate/anthranilate synthase component II [Thermomicrobiales bacterium]